MLIVGLGSIGLKHYNALKAINKKINVLALRSKKKCNKIDGISNIFSLKEIKFTIDFAIISNPTFQHFKTIEDLISLNIPLMIEKPISNNLNGSEKLEKLIKQQNIITYVACNLRFHPCIKFLKEEIKNLSDKINEVNIYCGSYLPDWRPALNYKKIYSSINSMGGGVHLDLIHELDYASWIFGSPNQSHCSLTSKSNLNIDADDYANYLLKYNNFNISIILNYYRPIAKRTIEIIFSNEIWEVDLLKNTIKNMSNDIIFQCKDYNIINTYESQLKYFILCIEQNIKPMNSFKESLNILKICLSK